MSRKGKRSSTAPKDRLEQNQPQLRLVNMDTLRTEIKDPASFHREFANIIRQCFWILNVDSGKVEAVSDNFEKVWGASRHVLADGLTGFMANVLPEDRDRVLSDFHTHLGQEFEMELRVVDSNNEVRWLWLRTFPVQKETAQQRVLLVADDVTDKKTQEEAIRAKEAELARNARISAFTDLASGIAHEINNPLTIILGKAERALKLLESPTLKREELTEALTKIHRTSIRISDIIRNLSALPKQEKSPVYQPSSVAKIFKDVRDFVSEKFKTGGVSLELPTFPPDLTIEVNETLIWQVFLNLLNNAYDAVQSQKEKWVKVEWTEDKESIFFYVTDSGPGIPVKIRSLIFEPFFTTKEEHKGTGLGLWLTSSIIAHHNGIIRLDTYHPYTRFTIQLPKKMPRSPRARSK